MEPIKFFKHQAKNLYKDLKTQYTYIDDVDGETYVGFKSTYFDIDQLFLDWDEEPSKEYTLTQAQHLFAQMMDFNKWFDLINAPEKQLELLVLLFKEKIHPEEWSMCVIGMEEENDYSLSLTSDYVFQISVLEQVYSGKDTLLNERDTYLLYDFK